MQRYDLYLNLIREGIEKIEKSFEGKSKKDLEDDVDFKDATYMRIQTIGESVNKLPEWIKKKYPEVRWSWIKNSRDIISHVYLKVNTKVIWDLIKSEFPKLKKVINDIQK